MDCSLKIPFEELQNKLIEISRQNPKLRSSKKREYILKALYDSQKHLTPEELYSIVKREYEPEIGLATVYRSLIFFEDFGLVNSIALKDGIKRYEINCDQLHDHIICTECGRIDEFHRDEIDEILQDVAKSKGYIYSSKSVKAFGICPDCQAKS